MTALLLEMCGIGKRFGGVQALEGVDLRLGAGEVLALIGENGAGKSTLMKVLGGVHQPDAGEVRFDGRPVQIRGVGDAQRHGIAFVHQELNGIEHLDLAANVFLGREPTRGGLIQHGVMRRRTAALLERLGLDVSPRTPLGRLSLAQRQLVEIAKALSIEARIVILDEPTSSLSSNETERLLEIIGDLRRAGLGLVYISHRLGEVLRIADRVTGLRDGRLAGELDRAALQAADGHERMIALMVGRKLEIPPRVETARAMDGAEPALELRGLRTPAHPEHEVTLRVRSGEILGLAGLVGAGRSELATTLFGLTPPLAGEVLVDGRAVRPRSPADALRAGVMLVPEDRRRSGLIAEWSVRANLSLPGLGRLTRAGLLRRAAERALAAGQIDRLRIKTDGGEANVLSLSGGNQQKVVLGKWLALGPRVLIVDEPTRGVDIRSKQGIYAELRGLAAQGLAVLMITSDMEELLAVSDRIAVMSEGRLSGELQPAEFSEEAVIRLAVPAGAAA